MKIKESLTRTVQHPVNISLKGVGIKRQEVQTTAAEPALEDEAIDNKARRERTTHDLFYYYGKK